MDGRTVLKNKTQKKKISMFVSYNNLAQFVNRQLFICRLQNHLEGLLNLYKNMQVEFLFFVKICRFYKSIFVEQNSMSDLQFVSSKSNILRWKIMTLIIVEKSAL